MIDYIFEIIKKFNDNKNINKTVSIIASQLY
jgi:hypothetical protein